MIPARRSCRRLTASALGAALAVTLVGCEVPGSEYADPATTPTSVAAGGATTADSSGASTATAPASPGRTSASADDESTGASAGDDSTGKSGDGVSRALEHLDGLAVVRTGRLTVAAPSRAQALAHLDVLRRSAARVEAAWPAWTEHAVVIVPRDAGEMSNLLGNATSSEVAAVTIGPVASAGFGSRQRVVLNPVVLGDLTERGRLVVLTHELAHVAIRSTTGEDTPLWWSEGLAEHLAHAGLSGTGGTDALASQLAARGLPEHLPTKADFDPSSPGGGDLLAQYQAARIAIDLLVEEHGLAAVREVTRRAAHGSGGPTRRIDTAMKQQWGSGIDEVTRQWRAHLREGLG
ncbi:hypothetical protein [Janibacter sp. G56]|uniref:hypothetical protein n=1 Tax=Janibacter sp. G56 TaxID=3418717 RepID=UPI003D080D34